MKYFLPFLVFTCLLFGMPAHAQQPYEVENVKINLKGVNPVEARDKAFEAAQIKAFKALFKGLNNGETLAFDESRIPALIEDFELTDEQIAPSRYAATYTFRFRRIASEEFARETQYAQGAVQPGRDLNAAYNPNNPQQPSVAGTYSQLYGNQNEQMIQVRSQSPYAKKSVLLLPYWKVGTNVVLWGQNNAWQNTWKRLENVGGASNSFTLPIGDLDDMRQTSGRLPETAAAIAPLLARYQVDNMIVAVGERAVSSITTTLYKADKSGLTFWKVIDSPFGPEADLYSVAAGQVMAELSGNSNPARTSQMPVVAGKFDQKRENTIIPRAHEPFFTAATAPIQSVIRAESRFQSPKEWIRLKNSMTPENGISNVRVISLTPKSAMVELQLTDSVPQVQQNLGGRRVSLTETAGSQGQYVLRFAG